MSLSGDDIAADALLTINEVATALRVSKMTIYRLVHDGSLPAARIGRSFRVRASALRTYLHSGSATQPQPD